MVVKMHCVVFWTMILHTDMAGYHPMGKVFTLKMEAASPSETLVTCHIPI